MNQQTLELRGNITGSGDIVPYIPELQTLFEQECKALSTVSGELPDQDVNAFSVSRATATSSGGKTKIYIKFKDFSVSMADLEGMNSSDIPDEIMDIFESLSSSVVSGGSTVKISLKNSYIDCVVDEKTGQIIDGTWSYDVDVIFGNAEILVDGTKLSIIDFCIPFRITAVY